MTREDFKKLDWEDSHVGYDIVIKEAKEHLSYRHITYITSSQQNPKCLLLVADDKKFPAHDTGCGYSKNPCPADVLDILDKHSYIDEIVAAVDGNLYILDPKELNINAVDAKVAFTVTGVRLSY